MQVQFVSASSGSPAKGRGRKPEAPRPSDIRPSPASAPSQLARCCSYGHGIDSVGRLTCRRTTKWPTSSRISGASASSMAESCRTRNRSVGESGNSPHQSRLTELKASPGDATRLWRRRTARSRPRIRTRCQTSRCRWATSPRSGRTSAGGIQTVGISPAANNPASTSR